MPAEERTRAKLLVAFFLSALLHGLLLTFATWRSGAWVASAPAQLIEARLIVANPSRDEFADPASRPPSARRDVPSVAPPGNGEPPRPSPAAAAPLAAPPRDDGTRTAGLPATPAPPQAQAVREGTGAPPPMAPSPQTMTPALPPAPDYRLAGALSPPPKVLEANDPEYPPGTQAEEGTVVLRLLISSTGHLDEAAVVRSFPPGMFDASALAAFKDAKFAPGYLAGIPVKSQMTLELKYTPINRGSAVSGRR